MAAGIRLLVVVAGLLGAALGTRMGGHQTTPGKPATCSYVYFCLLMGHCIFPGDRTIPGVDVWAFIKCVFAKQACLANKDCTGAGSTGQGQFCDITAL